MFYLLPDPNSQNAFDELARVFTNLALRIGSAEKNEIHEAVLEGFQDNFRSEASGQGPWARLTEYTQRDRVSQGYPAAHPILFRSGDYYRSLTDADNGEHFMQSFQSSNWLAMEIGSESSLFSAHEGGANKMPARSVTDLTAPSEGRVGEAITGMIHRLLAREGL